MFIIAGATTLELQPNKPFGHVRHSDITTQKKGLGYVLMVPEFILAKKIDSLLRR